MKIKILDKTKADKLTVGKEYNLIKREINKDDIFYLIKNDENKNIYVNEMIADEIKK